MIVHRERAKLIACIVYFAQKTRYCGKIKLIKLLYLLDFEHFRQTGRSVTGLDYRAWKLGPVPFSLFQEWEAPEDDFTAAVEIVPERVIDHTRETVVAKVAFDDSYFTKRELRLMEALAERFRDSYSKPLIDVTHRELGPWEIIWDGGRGNDERIPYALAIDADDPNAGAIRAAAREYDAIAKALAS